MQDESAANESFAILKHIFNTIPFNQHLGMRLTSLTLEEAVIDFTRRDEFVGNFLHDILHGGIISSVLDTAGGVVAMASVLHKHPAVKDPVGLAGLIGKCSTIDLHIHYLRPARGHEFIAKAFLVKSGSKIIFTRMEFTSQDQTLIAAGTATYRY